MALKLTTENFIEKARNIHGDKYDYSKVEYVNNQTKICIICPEHGEFWQIPNYHLSGCGCPKCGIKKIWDKRGRITTEEFIKKARNIHGDKYDYSKVEYIDIYTKICIICPEHGEFWQIPNNHLNNKRGCPKCGELIAWDKRGRTTTENFIEKARNIHGDKYDYSKVEYVKSNSKVCIICPEHGEFWQTPSKHINRKQGCPKCGIKKIWDKRGRTTTENFIEKARNIHGDKYDYSKVNYINDTSKICIICPEHGEFWQTPSNHLMGKICPKCANEYYVSEQKLYESLLKEFNKEEIIQQYRDKEIFGRKSIDIFFPKYSIAIEYQGRQHFVSVTKFGGEKTLKSTIKRDMLKQQECINNNIILLYFTYDKTYIPKNYFSDVIVDFNVLKTKINNIISSTDGSR